MKGCLSVLSRVVGSTVAILAMLAIEQAWGVRGLAIAGCGSMLVLVLWVLGGPARRHVQQVLRQQRAGGGPTATEPPLLPAWQRLLCLACPHCGLQAMSPIRKWGLGWNRAAPCRACGLHLANEGLPWAVPLAPMLTALLAWPMVTQLSGGWAPGEVFVGLLIGGGAVSLPLCLLRPFVCQEVSDPAAVEHARRRHATASPS